MDMKSQITKESLHLASSFFLLYDDTDFYTYVKSTVPLCKAYFPLLLFIAENNEVFLIIPAVTSINCEP